jgi:zona occludens toxin
VIELITGLPGNGKTLYTISQVKAQSERENRQVYYHGIPELSLNWERLEDPTKWADVPPNSIVVIDEAQKTFRNRSLGSTPPKFVTDLETHRHLGIDIVMITQHPSLIDPAVRRLAGRHRHLIRIWGTEASTVHKWDSVKDNCDKSRADSDKTKWGFDKSVYKLYKSAEVHTVKRSIPQRVKVLLGLCAVFVCLVAYMAFYLKSKTQATAPAVASSTSSSAPGSPSVLRSPDQAVPLDPMEDLRRYAYREEPRVSGLPHTAPKYDQITEPVRAPVPAACVQIGRPQDGDVKCKCYTQQGTPMGVEFNMCVEFARNGYFQDFDPESDRRQSERAAAGERVLASVANVPPSGAGRVVVFDRVPDDVPRVQGIKK